ncbi:dihydrodipicolinate synthase family protein [Pollutimonas sp. H1-120]|uniref:dihydrodipicolinate synthase family protein n=1 Tax=Pollutimonas sp. H1-120 TaxID=3148824 RepID=UPI003B52634A
MNSLLQGLSAFPITPADKHGIVDTETLGMLVARLRDAEVDSICVLGSTGTYAYLSRRERRRGIQAALSHAGRTPVMAGIGALRSDEVLALGKDAQEAGAAAVLLAPVSYTPLSDDEVFGLFETVAAQIDIPICIYNNPGTTHFAFSPELIGRLSALPGVIGAKNPVPDPENIAQQHAALKALVPTDFSLGYSGDWNAAEALLAGGEAWYSVAAGLFPEPCLAIVRAAQAGQADRARSLNAAMEPLWSLFRRFTSLRVMYAAANSLGVTQAEPPLPIRPLSGPDHVLVQAVVEELANINAGSTKA